jgi:hypothetical protein
MSRRDSGFTIIELTLAMSFVAVLLVSVAMLSIQLTNQYSRGLTLKETTQAGTEVANDIKRTIAQAQIQNGGIRTKDVPNAKVLCTGTYSYIASTPTALEAGQGVTIQSGPSGAPTPARFVKVRDSSGSLCGSPSVLDTDSSYETTDAVELLAGGSRLLSVREMSVSPTPAQISQPSYAFYNEFQQGRGFYTVSITITAGLTSELDLVARNCKPPKNSQANTDFCAVNTFDITSRVGSSNRQ